MRDEEALQDLYILPPVYDLDNHGAELSLSFRGIHAAVRVDTGENSSVISEKIIQRYSRFVEEDEIVLGIYKERWGPIYPLDVVARCPRGFNGKTYFVYIGKPTKLGLERLSNPHKSRFDFDLLVNPTDASDQLLLEQMRRYGHIRCVLNGRFAEAYSKITKAAAMFYSMPKEEKNKLKLEDEHQSLGFTWKRTRELFHVHSCMFKDATKPTFCHPDLPSFMEDNEECYWAFKEVAMMTLRSIARGMKIPLDYIEKITEEEETPWKYSSSLRLFQYNPVSDSGDCKYNPDDEDQLQCVEHADSTLITINPCTKPEEVEMLDRSTGKWFVAEEDAEEQEVVIFFGTFLAWITGGYLIAPLHRVVHHSQDKRISTPFFLRSPLGSHLRRKIGDEFMPHVPRNSISILTFAQDQEENLPTLSPFWRSLPSNAR
eukprot:TRINITY_DN4632_c0_g1_i1.p1 TRINITY_DN4632_c0_g1~~TRINITY_DN4632_c0_g1_i1.p1  ORF type:complete len:442 (+),score=127.65 TRINITY_DN4632_c0_g1_i1:39-1328(+)